MQFMKLSIIWYGLRSIGSGFYEETSERVFGHRFTRLQKISILIF